MCMMAGSRYGARGKFDEHSRVQWPISANSEQFLKHKYILLDHNKHFSKHNTVLSNNINNNNIYLYPANSTIQFSNAPYN